MAIEWHGAIISKLEISIKVLAVEAAAWLIRTLYLASGKFLIEKPLLNESAAFMFRTPVAKLKLPLPMFAAVAVAKFADVAANPLRVIAILLDLLVFVDPRYSKPVPQNSY